MNAGVTNIIKGSINDTEKQRHVACEAFNR